MNAIEQAIVDACCADDELNQNDDFYVGSNIPAEKARNLAGTCAAAGLNIVDSVFLAVIDATVFGSCKNGLAIAESGFYTHNDWSAECKSGFVPWSELVSNGHIRKTSRTEVQFLRINKIGIDLSGSDVGCDDCINLFERLRAAITPLLGAPEPSAGGQSAPQGGAMKTTWTCEWCGRTNDGGNQCQGCGAPLSK